MSDAMTFERRLAASLDAYAERMPTEVDAVALVRATLPQPRFRWWAGLSRPARRLILVTLLVLALLGAAAVGALVLRRLAAPAPVNLFAPTGSLLREGVQRAVLLADGRVLVYGETQPPEDQPDLDPSPWSEVYEPQSGAFSAIAAPFAYPGMTLTLVEGGRLLISGGPAGGPLDARIPREDRSMVWDPQTGDSVPVRLTTPRAGHAIALLHDGRVLIAGGFGMDQGSAIGTLASAELWDPRSGLSTGTGAMSQEREGAGAVTLPDGRVLVVGGKWWTINSVAATAHAVSIQGEIYDPGTGTWAPLAPEPEADTRPIFLLVGPSGIGGRLFRVDLRAGTATDVTPFPDSMQVQVAIMRADGEGLVPSLCHVGQPECRVDYAAVLLPGSRVLFVGGDVALSPSPASSDGDVRIAEAPATSGIVLDLSTGSLIPTGPMVSPRRQPFATLLADGRVLVIAGDTRDDDLTTMPTAEVYTP